MSFVQDCDGAHDNIEAWHKGPTVQKAFETHVQRLQVIQSNNTVNTQNTVE